MSCKVSAKCKLMMAALSIFVSASVFASFSDGRALGGMPKKCIGLYFDVMNTTPSNILANADQFAKSAPYLDGVAIGLHNIPVVTSDGKTATSQYRWIMHKSHRWTRDAVKSQLPYLKEIVKKPNLTESMLLFWMTPHGNHERLDWADDKAWANYAENMASVAWLAKAAGLKGFMLDPEEYRAQGGKDAQYVHSHRDPSYRETAKLARQRGREVFSRVFKEFPDAVIFSLWGFYHCKSWLQEGRQPYPLSSLEQSGELLHCFLNGIIDAMPPEARFVDGMEVYACSSLENAYMNDYITGSITALPLIEKENLIKYRSQFLFSNGHFVDMYAQERNPKSNYYFGPVNGSRLEHLRLNLEQGLRSATEYIWFYGENGGKLFNWRDGHYAKKKTWEEAIPGFTEVVMLAKDPIRYAALRKAELAKEGKLVNLVKNQSPIHLGGSDASREFHLREYAMPEAKVKYGERYAVVMKTIEYGVGNDTSLKGATRPSIFYRPATKTNIVRIPLKVHYDKGKDSGGCYTSTIVVEPPKDVKTLVCDPGAFIGVDERVSYRSVAVYNLFDPVNPPKSERSVKWMFDPSAGKLTDGNWVLAARLDKKKGELTVSGNDEKTVGSGVLDFTSVKADTGYSVVSLGKMKNVSALTALYAPDLIRVFDGGLSGCSNVVAVTLGEMPKVWWARLPEEIRAGRLETLGLKAKLDMKFKAFDHRHKRSYVQHLSDQMRVKGLKAGELYSMGLSMKRRGPGALRLSPKFRSTTGAPRQPVLLPRLTMSQPREDDVWQSGEAVVRVPQWADEISLDIKADITEGSTEVELKDFTLYRLGGPLPKWPAEFEKPKMR